MFIKGMFILICCSLSPEWLGNINKTIPVHKKINIASCNSFCCPEQVGMELFHTNKTHNNRPF